MFEDHNKRKYEISAVPASNLLQFVAIEGSPGPLPKGLSGWFTRIKEAQRAWDVYLKVSGLERKNFSIKENKELQKQLPATSKKALPSSRNK